MANFKHHLMYGVTASVSCATVGYLYLNLTPVQSLATIIIGTVASLAPDIDHTESIPGKILFDILAIIVPIIGIPYLYRLPYLELPKFHTISELQSGFALEQWIVYFSLNYLLIKLILCKVFHACTIHRGMFHSIPAMLSYGECFYFLFSHVERQQQIFMGVVAGICYGIHLIVDEWYSVDWQGQTIKKSFGTALDFGDFHKYSTWLTYGLLGGLSWLIWITL